MRRYPRVDAQCFGLFEFLPSLQEPGTSVLTFFRGTTGRHETVAVVATTRPVASLYHYRQDSHVSTHSAVPRLVDLSITRTTQRVGLEKGEPSRTIVCVLVPSFHQFPRRGFQRA